MNFLFLLLLFSKTNITLTSTAFAAGADIPQKYTCEGQNINPPLAIGEVPKGTKSLALIVDDPDAPKGVVTHWVAYNISPETMMIAENSRPGIQGKNEKGEPGYMGPCPPDGQHHYYFQVFALDTKLTLKDGAGKKEVIDAINGHILAEGELIGLYTKKTPKQ